MLYEFYDIDNLVKIGFRCLSHCHQNILSQTNKLRFFFQRKGCEEHLHQEMENGQYMKKEVSVSKEFALSH